MAIANDWDIDFVNRVIRHVDGTMDYDSNAGTAPSQYDYLRGGTSGSVFQVLSGSDLGGTDATGSLKITNTTGQLTDTEALTVLDRLFFDTVTNGGFAVDGTLEVWDGTTGTGSTFIVYAVEYDGTAGTAFGAIDGTADFTENADLRVDGSSQTVALVTLGDTNGDGTADAAYEDNAGLFTSVAVAGSGAITPQTTSKLVHYDTGTTAIPRFGYVYNNQNPAAATAEGLVQQIYGVTATGSLRLVDSTGTWADDVAIYLGNSVPYDALQTGQKFRVNDFVSFRADSTSDATGQAKIIELVTTDATSGRIVLMNVTGTISDNDEVWVGSDYIADVDDANEYYTEQRATANAGSGLTSPENTTQYATQGGLYGSSLNPVRDCNALYTHLQDTFDELGQLDDTIPMSAQVRLQQYTLINNWTIPDLSFRFLESGSIQDSALANIWTNFQTLGTVFGVTDLGYLPQSEQPPQVYIEQDGSVIDPWWITGHIDVLVKVRTNSLPTLDNIDGQYINSGTVTIFAREYGNLYDHFETTTIAGVAPIPLATATDLNNTTGTHVIPVSADPTGDFTVGELIIDGGGSPNEEKRGIVTALTTSPNTIEYVQVGTSQFASADTIAATLTTNTATASDDATSVVAGYGPKMVVATVDATVNGSVASGTFIDGEEIVQTSSGAKAIYMADTGSVMTIGNYNDTTNADDTGDWTGQTSDATWTPSAVPSSATTIGRDIGDGSGDKNYNAVIYLNRANDATGQTLTKMYEWIKYRTRRQETGGEPPDTYAALGGPGTADDGVAGQIYITLSTSYPLVKQSPFGTFAGGTFFGAQGVFIQDMADADIRNFQLTDSAGTLRFPPNRQVLTVAGLVSGDRVAVFRRISATPGSAILTAEFAVSAYQAVNDWNGSNDTIIRVDSSVDRDHPDSGVVRVEDSTTGLYNSYNYTAFSIDGTASDFTLDATIGRDLVAGEEVFVPLMEREADATAESAQIIYLTDIPLLARVRKKGILPFEVEGTFGSGGTTITAIRTSDTIVD